MTRSFQTLLLAAALFNLALAAFHMTFWKLFQWPVSLGPLGNINRGILYVLNLAVTAFFVLAGVLLLAYPHDVATTGLGQALLWGLAFFWLARSALQPAVFGFSKPASIGLFVVFLGGAALHGLAALTASAAQEPVTDANPDPAGIAARSMAGTQAGSLVAYGREPASSPGAAPSAGSSGGTVATCTQFIRDAADFAISERNAAYPPRAGQDEPSRAELEGLLQRPGNGDRENLLVSLLLRPSVIQSGDPSAGQFLAELGELAVRSRSPLLAWHTLRACEGVPSCPLAHLEPDLLEVDRQNAESWALVAMLRFRRGDVSGALTAMQGAAGASTSTWYWTDTVALIERSLAVSTTMLYPDRLGEAFGSAASTLPSQRIAWICRTESGTSREWAKACLAFGNLRAERNEALLARSTSYAVREQALAAIDEWELAAKISREHSRFSEDQQALVREPAISMTRLQEALVATHPARLVAYLDAIRESGESAGARQFLRQELPPLLERAGLLQGNELQDCVTPLIEDPARGSASIDPAG